MFSLTESSEKYSFSNVSAETTSSLTFISFPPPSFFSPFFPHLAGHSVDEKIEEFETVLISLKDDMEDLNAEISNLNITVNDLPIHSKQVRERGGGGGEGAATEREKEKRT